MISDLDACGPNIFPGRLKSVVIGLDVSIAFAGAAEPALYAIRQAKLMYSSTKDLRRLILYLRQTSVDIAARDSHCEFIISSHADGATMFKIWDGLVATGENTYWIGNCDVAMDSLNFKASISLPEKTKLPDYITPEECRFCNAVTGLTLKRGTQIAGDVGGLIVVQIGSLYGHGYLNHAATIAWDTIRVPPGLSEQQIEDRNSGMTQYAYTTIRSLERGAAVLGVYFDQPKIGFIYSPITHDEAYKIAPATLEQMSEEVTRLAREIGGLVCDVDLHVS